MLETQLKFSLDILEGINHFPSPMSMLEVTKSSVSYKDWFVWLVTQYNIYSYHVSNV